MDENAGSSPVVGSTNPHVAQLDRASVYETEGCWFNSSREGHLKNNNMSIKENLFTDYLVFSITDQLVQHKNMGLESKAIVIEPGGIAAIKASRWEGKINQESDGNWSAWGLPITEDSAVSGVIVQHSG